MGERPRGARLIVGMPGRAPAPVALPVAGARAVACSGGGSHASSGPVDDAGNDGGVEVAPTILSLTVSTGILRPAFDPNVTDYDVTSLNSLYPITATATTS